MRAVADYRDFATFSDEQVLESMNEVQALIREITEYVDRL